MVSAHKVEGIIVIWSSALLGFSDNRHLLQKQKIKNQIFADLGGIDMCTERSPVQGGLKCMFAHLQNYSQSAFFSPRYHAH